MWGEGEREKIQKTIQSLRKNRMDAELVENREMLLQKLDQLIPPGARIASGGSVTLQETGVEAWMHQGNRIYLSMEDAHKSEWYLMSSNAVTEEGELWNVDGNGNRVSALIYGPEHVVIVVGMNKIVADREAAEQRIRTIAAPKNSQRLGKNTGCARTGYCVDCKVADRICCTTVISSYQRHEGRIKVYILPEAYGY